MTTTENSKVGYYTRDTGQNVYHYFMGDEPPLEQYVLIGDVWLALIDKYYLMDKIIDGDPTVSGPTKYPPLGVPPKS